MATTVTTTGATNIKQYSAFTGGEVIPDKAQMGDYKPIVDRLLEEKFRLYNQHRQIIKANIKRTTPLKPFSMFQNTKENDKPFMLIGYSWNVCDDMYSVDLFEYDNTTEVNLVEG